MPDGVYIKWKMRKAIYCVPVPGRSITQKDSKGGENTEKLERESSSM